MRRRIYLVRHGEVQYFGAGAPVAYQDVALTAAGREQAQAAGRALRDVRFQRVVTSGLPRTMDTARLILAEQQHPAPDLEAWPELEELRAGPTDDIPDAELEQDFLRAFDGAVSLDERFLRGESIGSLVDRVGAELDRVLADERWDTVLLVLHGGVNRAILSRALTGERRFLGHVEQSPGCINILDLDGARWLVRAVNATPVDLAQSGPRTTTIEEMLAECRAARRPV